MRREPTWRIPIGLLGLLCALAIYGLVIARYVPEVIGGWPTLAQTAVYIALGLAWLMPMGGFLKWMETGRWR